MKGAPNTKIRLKIMRKGADAPVDVAIVREVIRVRPVSFHAEGGDIGYIRITTFNEQTTDGLRKAITEISKAIPQDKLAGYVIDLRNNPGGLLDQAVSVSSAFMARGEVVSTRGRTPEETQRFTARGGDLTKGKPLVVLINGGSASASEIVAGALHDHKRATIIGTRSFGKGSVQTIIPLGAGNGALALTTARYFTPSGKSIQAQGITPDIEVLQDVPDELKSRADIEGRGVDARASGRPTAPSSRPARKPTCRRTRRTTRRCRPPSTCCAASPSMPTRRVGEAAGAELSSVIERSWIPVRASEDAAGRNDGHAGAHDRPCACAPAGACGARGPAGARSSNCLTSAAGFGALNR